MKIFVISYVTGENLGAYASDLPMEEFLGRWKPGIVSSKMTLGQTQEFARFLDNQKEAIKLDEITQYSFGYLNVWKND